MTKVSISSRLGEDFGSIISNAHELSKVLVECNRISYKSNDGLFYDWPVVMAKLFSFGIEIIEKSTLQGV